MKYALLILFFFVSNFLVAQVPPDMSIPTPTSSFDPFGNNADGTPWTIVNGTPQIIETTIVDIGNVFLIKSAKGLTFCTDEYGYEMSGTRPTSVEMEGLFFPFAFKEGKTYLLTGFMMTENSPDDISVILANDFDNFQETETSPFADQCDPPSGSTFMTRSFVPITIDSDLHQKVSVETDLDAGTSFVPFSVCIVPDANYTQLWFYIEDDDTQVGMGDVNSELVATWLVGGLEMTSFEDKTSLVTYNRTESNPDDRPYYVHNMLPPVTVADTIILEPKAPFGINVLENDEPLILIGNEIIIAPTSTDFDFTVAPFIDPNVENRLIIRAAVDEEEFYSYNDSSNYFSVDQMDIRNEADFLDGYFYDSQGYVHFGNEVDTFNNMSYVYDESCKRCLIVPAVFAAGGDHPYYNAWSPLAIGYPEKYNARAFELLVQKTNETLLFEDDGEKCIDEELTIVYSGENANFDISHVNIEWELSNCKDVNVFNANIDISWPPPSPGEPINLNFSERWEKRDMKIKRKIEEEAPKKTEEGRLTITGDPIELGIFEDQQLQQTRKYPVGLSSWGQQGAEKNVFVDIEPNPSFGKTLVRFYSKNASFVDAGLYSQNGNLAMNLGRAFVVNGETTEFVVNVDKLTPGLFFIKIKTSDDIYIQKMIVL